MNFDNRKEYEFQVPPHNLEAEEAIIASFLLGNKDDDVFDIITADDFYRKSNAIIFFVIEKLRNSDAPIDLIAVSEALRGRGELEMVGGISSIVSIMEGCPVGGSAHYAKIIKATSTARQLLQSAYEIAKIAYTTTIDDIVDVLDSAQSKIMGIKYESGIQICRSVGDICSDRVDFYEEMSKGKRKGIMTGFPTIDKVTGGLSGSRLVIIAARPRIGKTAFMLNLAKNMARNHHKVGIFEIEMDGDRLGDRLIASGSKINSIRLTNGEIRTSEEWTAVVGAVERISQYRIDVDDTGGLTISELKRRSRVMVKNGCEIIFIDQLSKIRGGKGKSEYEQRSFIVNELMDLKKELRIPVILLAQINRNADNRSTTKPTLADLKSTGSLEEDSDMVLLGHRPFPYTKKEEDRTRASWEIAKHRDGAEWNIEMVWQEKTATFYEPARDYETK